MNRNLKYSSSQNGFHFMAPIVRVYRKVASFIFIWLYPYFLLVLLLFYILSLPNFIFLSFGRFVKLKVKLSRITSRVIMKALPFFLFLFKAKFVNLSAGNFELFVVSLSPSLPQILLSTHFHQAMVLWKIKDGHSFSANFLLEGEGYFPSPWFWASFD